MLGSNISLHNKREFGYVFRAGKKQVGRLMVVYAVKNGLERNRYGIITSKKVGNAVTRNRAKRRLREMVRRLDGSFNIGFDIVIVARLNITKTTFQDMLSEGQKLLKRVGL